MHSVAVTCIANYEQTQNLNKLKSSRVGSARFTCFAKTTNEIQKINQTQTTNKSRIRTNPKIASRVSSVRSAKTTTNQIQKAIKAKLASVDDKIV